VNTPFITSLTNDSCVNPPLIQTRMGGGGTTDLAVWNATTGLFHYANLITDGNNVCINGNCALPGENAVVNDGCYGSVSVFTIDADAPMGAAQRAVRAAMQPLVAFENPDAKMMLKARATESSKHLNLSVAVALSLTSITRQEKKLLPDTRCEKRKAVVAGEAHDPRDTLRGWFQFPGMVGQAPTRIYSICRR
jgi:hypothetical protein